MLKHAESPVFRTRPDLSHLQIFKKLGNGGAGLVCEAEDTLIHHFVALKCQPKNSVKDPLGNRTGEWGGLHELKFGWADSWNASRSLSQ